MSAGPAIAATSADGTPGNTADVAVTVSARDQLEAIRDEWLAPLVAQITEQAEMIGGLRTELEHERQQTATAIARAEAAESRVSALEAQQTEAIQYGNQHAGDAATTYVVAVLADVTGRLHLNCSGSQ